jgi:hypothetical protein
MHASSTREPTGPPDVWLDPALVAGDAEETRRRVRKDVSLGEQADDEVRLVRKIKKVAWMYDDAFTFE